MSGTRWLLVIAVLAGAALVALWRTGGAPEPGTAGPRPSSAPGATPGEASPTARPAPRQVPTPAAPELTGIVRDQDGGAVPGTELRMTFGVRAAWSEPLATLRTDAAGAFRCSAEPLHAVSPLQRPDLSVTIVATAAGFHPERAILDFDEAQKPIVLQLLRYDPDDGRLWGEVLDRSGAPVADALICRDESPREEYTATDECGRYATTFLDAFAAGPPETLFAFHPECGVSLPVLAHLPRRGQQLRLDFALTETDPQVDGVALGVDGLPLAGVRLLVQLEAEAPHAPRPRYRTSASIEIQTGSDGRFQLRGYPPGRYGLRWSRYGDGSFFLAELPITERSVHTAEMPIELRIPAVPVDFELSDPDGRPLRDAVIAGTVTPPAGTEAEPQDYELRHSRRLWLPPGTRGTWQTRGNGIQPQAGDFAVRESRVVVHSVLLPR